MKARFLTLIVFAFVAVSISAQTSQGSRSQEVRHVQPMRWVCPEVEKYQSLLYSLRNDDYKVYANNIKDKIELFSDPEQPTDKYLVTQAVFNIENPLFSPDNLFNHISTWIRAKKKDWANNLIIDVKEQKITSTTSVHVASHATFLDVFKVSVSPILVIQLLEDNRLIVAFSANSYKINAYDSHNKLVRSLNDKIYRVFPFVQNSSYKNTYAKAYVATYLYFWNFISDLRYELNTHFVQDSKKLNQWYYEHLSDSLRAKYGEPTKVIADQTTTPDINKELRFYENAQKFIFMGKTIDFKDIISCEIVDDPKFIPGRTTSYGLGFSIFGIGIGGADSYTIPDKTIHNYVVNVKIDNMGTPLIYIATGQNEQKANEIAAVFEYILRHQQGNKAVRNRNSGSVGKRTKR